MSGAGQDRQRQDLAIRLPLCAVVRELLTYISRHLDQEVTLDTLASLTGYSSFYLHRILREELGEPIGSFILRQRMETAAYLLCLTDTPVFEIKHLVGYATDSSFSKAFRKVMGVSPSAYRKSNQYLEAVSGLPREYVSLSPEMHRLPARPAIVFPAIGDYFKPEFYAIWEDVERYILGQQLSADLFEYFAVLHVCQNTNAGVPGRFDAAIVPKPGVQLSSNRFFLSEIPGGKFVRYRFCSPASEFRTLALEIGRHMTEEGIPHGTGVSYFRFAGLPDYRNPDDHLIDWYLPVQ